MLACSELKTRQGIPLSEGPHEADRNLSRIKFGKQGLDLEKQNVIRPCDGILYSLSKETSAEA